ncbi:MAG: serine--tRNA ligase [archaeon]|nr:serine--tRNA ligase [archaeon]
MVLDINAFLVERGGDPDFIRESQRRRHADVGLVDKVIELQARWRAARHALDQLNAKLNATSKEIGGLMKAGKKDEATELRTKGIPAIKAEMARAEEECNAVEKERDATLNLIGNIVHSSVVVSADESDNEIARKVGSFARPQVAKLREHFELMELIGGTDLPRGAKVSGDRGYFLTGIGAQLNIALIKYGIDFMSARGSTAVQTPYFMAPDLMGKTAQLEDFDEQLYHVTTGSGGAGDKYLIATSEQPISCMHAGEWLQTAQLPIKYVGFSTCFRKESGSGGRDVRGIFRVHQFDKIEQFAITSPETSWDMHEEMTRNSEEFLQSLGLSYRVVVIASGALNNAASKKYDIEAWFPAYNDCRELVSASNCTDYQSRSLEIRYGNKVKGETTKVYAHMLNATLCATTRAICCILENHQTDTGINVPIPLRKYLDMDFIPFKTTASAGPASSSS